MSTEYMNYLDELESQLLIGDLEYVQLISDILAPVNTEFLVEMEAIQAVNIRGGQCRAEPIVRDESTFDACVKWVDEIKQGVISDVNFSKVVSGYDMSRLKGSDVFERSSYVESVKAKVNEVHVVNEPPLWLLQACEVSKIDVVVSTTDVQPMYKQYTVTSAPGLELHNMSRAYTVAMLPNPYKLIKDNAGVLSFSLFTNRVELIFVARHKVKYRYYSRDSAIRYNLSPLFPGLLLTDIKDDYKEVHVLKSALGDYYLPRVKYKTRIPLNRLCTEVDQLIEEIDVDNTECMSSCVSFQMFQTYPQYYPQVSLATRISSLECRYVDYEFNLFFACDVLVNVNVLLTEDCLINAGAKISYGNRYLYRVDQLLENGDAQVTLIDEDIILLDDNVYTPQTFTEPRDMSVNYWEDEPIEISEFGQSNFDDEVELETYTQV